MFRAITVKRYLYGNYENIMRKSIFGKCNIFQKQLYFSYIQPYIVILYDIL